MKFQLQGSASILSLKYKLYRKYDFVYVQISPETRNTNNFKVLQKQLRLY
jgi:hypothetical protein